jgi:hypothetical protein
MFFADEVEKRRHAMPTIVACFKWVIDEAYIRRSSSGELDFSSVDYRSASMTAMPLKRPSV